MPTVKRLQITAKSAKVSITKWGGEIERHTVGVAADKLAQWRKMCDKLDQLAKTKGLAFVSSDVFALCVLCPHAHLFAVM